MIWTDERKDELRALWAAPGETMSSIAARMGVTRNSILGASNRLGLQYHGGRAKTLTPEDDAAVYAATVFRQRVAAPDTNVLKTGGNQRKLGAVVEKGHWKGFPIYSLTLEERATCPRSCKLWLSCYGNNMGPAKRYAHGLALELQVWRELHALQKRHRAFVVRLHVLGDFYSVPYVQLWEAALDHFPGLHIFGYTARQAHTPIGRAIDTLRSKMWPRFAIRTSGARSNPRTTVIAKREDKHPDAIICPAQLGQTRNCSTCALCWGTMKPIQFLAH